MKDLEKMVNNEGLDMDDEYELNEEDLQKLGIPQIKPIRHLFVLLISY